jgi:hypothetical protein
LKMATKKKSKPAPMVMVGPGVEDEDLELDEEEDPEEPEEGEDEDEESGEPRKKPKAQKEEDSDSDEEDERVGHGEDDEEEGEEDGKPKKRDRESRKARRERQRRARNRNEIELNFLRTQNEGLEKRIKEIDSRVGKSEVGAIDQRISSIQSQLRVADQVLAKAHETGSGEDVVEATNIRDRLKDSLGRLNTAKTEFVQRTQESETEPQVDSRLVSYASSWMKSHSWYDPKGSDKDSRAVAAIDNRLVREGFDPRTPEYWEELSDRVEDRLPHRFKDGRNGRGNEDEDDDDDRGNRTESKRRSSGPRFSTGGRERPLRKNEVYVDPERKKALIEAGVWDDKVLRNKYLKKYAEWDRENPRDRAAR